MSDDAHDPDLLRAPTIEASGRRRWIYPDRRPGRLVTIRKRLAMVLMAVYLIVPFCSWQGRPLLRFDVLEGKFFFLTYVFPFQDTSYFVYVFILLALLLFLVTSLYGRLWCGYGCPQTVFVEWLIRPIEELVEGNARKRYLRDRGPLNFDKIWRKCVKYSIYVLVIFVISNAFLGFFVDPKLLFKWVTSPPAEHPWAFGFMLLLSTTLFLDLIWFREQFCSFLCPYARFQSVMIDNSTPTIAFDYNRGEPRGRKATSGDCINCQHCVRVCPTGIDIRNGLQLECIQCGRCADACDRIMVNLKRDPGLIRTASVDELEKSTQKTLRLRPFIYFLGIILILALAGIRVSMRRDLNYTFLRQPGTTYTSIDEGHFANYFQIRVNNQSRQTHQIEIVEPVGTKILCSICGKNVTAFDDINGNLVIIVPKGYERNFVKLKLNDNFEQKIPLILP